MPKTPARPPPTPQGFPPPNLVTWHLQDGSRPEGLLELQWTERAVGEEAPIGHGDDQRLMGTKPQEGRVRALLTCEKKRHALSSRIYVSACENWN